MDDKRFLIINEKLSVKLKKIKEMNLSVNIFYLFIKHLMSKKLID